MSKWINSIASTAAVGCLSLSLAACATASDKQATITQAESAAAQEAPQDQSTMSLLALASPATPAQIRAAARDASDPVICKTQNVSGSRLAKIKVCVRESEREASRSQTKIGLEDFHRRATTGVLLPGG